MNVAETIMFRVLIMQTAVQIITPRKNGAPGELKVLILKAP